MLSRSTIDTVDELSLQDAIGKYILLKKKGAGYEALSPFVEEKTPSFKVSPSKGMWKCFSSGIGGSSPISFVMEFKKMSYVEAIKDLAEKFHISIEYDDSERAQEFMRREEKKKSLYDINSLALEFFESQLINIPEQKKRAKDISYTHYSIGYAPKGTTNLKEYLLKKGISIQMMVDAGLVDQSQETPGTYYDKFRERIVFPIFSRNGKIVGFSGRYIGDKGPKEVVKVLNTKETDVYHKSESLLGLYQAIKGIQQMGYATLVEGNFDMTSLYEQGLPNVVASLGTALTQSHVELIKKFTSIICICGDIDDAGIKALEKNTRLFLENGFTVYMFIPSMDNNSLAEIVSKIKKVKQDFAAKQITEEEYLSKKKELETDPDDMVQLKEWTKNEFFNVFQNRKRDAVEEFAAMYFSEADTTIKKSGATNKLTELIACVQDVTLRNAYVKDLVKPYGIDRKSVEDQLKVELAKKLPMEEEGSKTKLPSYLKPEDIEDFKEFGFYHEQSKDKIGYYFPSGNGFERVSNFLIKPIIQVADKRESKRILEIKNKSKTILIELPNKSFASPQIFEELVMNHGNFDFQGSAKQFKKLRQKFLEQFPFCTQIKTLGWQKKGFWAFSDGIVIDGIFKKVDPYGICYVGEEKYFLPAFSLINLDNDEEDDDYESDRSFVYRASKVTFSEWSKKMIRVHQDNGMWAILYCIASIFREFIFNSVTNFPHFFGFGQVQTGKSTCARSMNSIFFGHQTPFLLSSGTNPGFYRRLARTRNAAVWFDEYSNEIDEKKFQALKGAFDGSGHERAVLSRDNRTETTKINSPLIITGQYLPTRDDNSLFTRSIMRTFSRKSQDLTIDDIKEHEELEEWEQNGLSNLIVDVLRFRDFFEENFRPFFSKTVMDLKVDLDGSDYVGRVMTNYAVVITIARMFIDKLNLPFKYEEVYEQGKESIISQSEQVSDSDALRSFWKMLEVMSWNYVIKKDQDYMVKTENSVTYREGRAGNKIKRYDQPTRVLYIRFSHVHMLYMQEHRKTFSQNGVPEQSIMSYMKTSKAFIGNCAAINFNGNKTSAYAFNYDELQLSLKDCDEESTVANSFPSQKPANMFP